MQGENVEHSLRRKCVLKTAQYRGAVGSPAQAAGEAEKAVLGHGAQFLKGFVFYATTNIAQPRPAQVNSSLKFDLWAPQLLKRFRLWLSRARFLPTKQAAMSAGAFARLSSPLCVA